MCGICGIINLENDNPISADKLQRMMESMKHRGPDDEGILSSGAMGFGFRRLSIIDLTTGNQPIWNEDRRIAVVCNGEIYNHQELRRELSQRGHRFKTNSDVEVVIHGYEEFGFEVIKRLRGMFAFALWDSNASHLFLGRDRLGVKPIYYAFTNGRFVFASEIKAILASQEIEARIDRQTLSYYLTLMYSPGELTLFQDIRKLLPGHYLVLSPKGHRIEKYWDISLDSVPKDGKKSFEDYLAETEHFVSMAVKSRLMSDVSLGAFLSGGIDSSLVVAFMHKFLGPGFKTFCIGFAEQKYNESPYAEQVSKKFGTEHHTLIINPDEMQNHIAEAIWYRDEPLAYASAVPLMLLSRFAAKHVKVVLSGEGGDELFAGYPKHVYDRFSQYYQLIPRFIRQTLSSKMVHNLPAAFRRAQIAARCLNIESDITRWTDWFAAFDTGAKEHLLNENYRKDVDLETETVYQIYLDKMNGASPLSKQLYLDSKVWLPDNLLMKGDKMTMSASLEGRVPLLDHHLVEFAFTIPDHIKIKGLSTKHLLRQLARKYLPSSLTSRRKVGFTVPVGLWFRNEWQQLLKKVVLSDRALQRGYFRPEAVREICEKHTTGRFDFQRELWVLFNLEMWQRIYIDNAPSNSAAQVENELLNRETSL